MEQTNLCRRMENVTKYLRVSGIREHKLVSLGNISQEKQ